MKILIVPDKFKNSLNAQQVCDAVGAGIKEVHPGWTIMKLPMADGGEGTCDILTSISEGRKITVIARDPLFREIETTYGLSPDGNTAFIEMARASGLQLLTTSERNPLKTSSIGTGDLIAHALRSGVQNIVLGCGGSATNDGGIGMASALGISFHDSVGNALLPIGGNLSRIKSINTSGAMHEISLCQFLLIADVDNPLHGLHGAAAMFAPQKGAKPLDVERLDSGLKKFEQVLQENYGTGITDFPGAGAAGGVPVSARAFLNAEMKPGIDFIMDFAGLEEKVRHADLMITGEGKLDSQSWHGKVISGVARLCRQHNKRLWVICGISEATESEVKLLGIEKVLTISSKASSQEESMAQANELIRKEIRRAMKEII